MDKNLVFLTKSASLALVSALSAAIFAFNGASLVSINTPLKKNKKKNMYENV